MAEDYDVIVVGAGPAGCSAAKSLSDYGFRVLVLDERPLPREKVCGGVISAATLEQVAARFGELPPEVFASPFPLQRERLFYPRGETLELRYDPPRRVLNRSFFDRLLAERSGAEILDSCEVELQELGRFSHLLRVRRGEESHHLRATYLIGADGAASPILQVLRPEFSRLYQLPSIRPAISLSFHLEECPGEDWRGVLMPAGKGRAARLVSTHRSLHLYFHLRAGEAWEQPFSSLKPLLEERCGVRGEVYSGKRLGTLNFMGYRGNFNLGAGSVLLAGEAAGLLDPWGDGIALALESGRIAGETIFESAGERVTPHVHYRHRMASLLNTLSRQISGKLAPDDLQLEGTPLDIRRISGRKNYYKVLKYLRW